ncbi:LAMI_0B08240g1_1 [Lachancea mirantina]|uniref:LAMI_0B08240g1_1 n=1 Tax=Lachancea mirantina TaxID=1230905 RepID=A0A1G4IXP0_9SACH|nr:LAMI_0B08240g1_1 [Lachancea mirantina]
MKTTIEPFRSLTSAEKRILEDNLNGQSNGVIFSAVYSKGISADTWSDEATLLTVKDQRLSSNRIAHTLATVIKNNPELFTAINNKLEFEPVQRIMFDDVVRKVEFESYKDEIFNCHNGIPPYLLRQIFGKSNFSVGKQEPLWQLFVVDEMMVIFHGHDVLFDAFAAANFHQLFLEALRTAQMSDAPAPQCIFKFGSSTRSLSKSIFENPKLHLPAISGELFQLQTQAFLRNIYQYTIKKPLDYFESNHLSPPRSIEKQLSEILCGTKELCGTVIFGNIPGERFKRLEGVISSENVCLKSFVCSIVLLCLKPLIRNFEGSINFAIPLNLRGSIPWSTPFGIFNKEVLVECPLSLVDDKNFQNLDVYNGYDPSSVKVNEKDPLYEETLLEYQFRDSVTFISNSLKQRWKAWERCEFNDDDIKRMKFSKPGATKASRTKTIEINDLSSTIFPMAPEGQFSIREACITRSHKQSSFMSISFCYAEDCGLSISIHYPEGYKMDSFVECFQSFMEELSRI